MSEYEDAELYQRISDKIANELIQERGEAGAKPWSFYEKMRKENPKEYKKPSTRQKMENDYAILGRAFEDGNFLR